MTRPIATPMDRPARNLSAEERLDWLRLIRSENVGPVSFFQLLRRFGAAAPALQALPDLARRGGRTTLRLCSRAEAERELAAAEAAGARLVAHGEAAYPPALAGIADAPPLLYVKGEATILTRPAIAVVGARNASASGVRLARRIAAELGAAGLVVVSGLARGIDTAAHGASLESGTVAVLAGGVDRVYPPENERLYQAIPASGAVLSEMPMGLVPKARHFPRRNRLISGLSFGVLVVEAAPRSGSLITARLAAEQGREVFAVPGSPLDPRHNGTNNLIRQGAVLTEGAEDILEVLAPMLGRPPRERPAGFLEAPAPPPEEAGLDAARRFLIDRLGPTPVEVDELVRQTDLTPGIVLTILLELELAGRLDRHPGNRVSLREQDTGQHDRSSDQAAIKP